VLEFKSCDIYFTNGVQPVQSWVANRGNSRRYHSLSEERRAMVPDSVNILDTIATHEAELASTLTKSKFYNFRDASNSDMAYRLTSPDNDQHSFVLTMGTAHGLPRPHFGKVMLYKGSWYFVMTWTDLFGASIKESQLMRSRNGRAVLFLCAADDESSTLLGDTLKQYQLNPFRRVR